MSTTHTPSTAQPDVYDLVVIGGGINGVGIAADAAGRGLSVFLCEKDDLASHTSSASSKLIHGGLRYLEHYEFRLVHEALAEREVLLSKAPHIVKPMRFILPHRPHLRPAWMIRCGLFLYDNLGKRKQLGASSGLKFASDHPLQSHISRGFEYADCTVDDARLVVLNAIAAREHGAQIHTRTRCTHAQRLDGVWQVELQHADGTTRSIRARALVNAAGPWVSSFIRDDLKQKSPYGIRLIQGSHIIVPRLHDLPQSFILQNEDNRIVFVIPYHDQFTLIGTTDKEYNGDPAKVSISDDEIGYLLNVVNSHFKRQILRSDIVSSYSGVRPLCDDESDNPSAVTRDYTLALSEKSEGAPLLSVFGGKLTTYRKLAEAAMHQLAEFFPKMGPAWTKTAPLPGAEKVTDLRELAGEIASSYNWLPGSVIKRWVNTYGSRTWAMLEGVRTLNDLGEHLGSGLYTREVDYLREHEWALTAEDILWRRSKLGLYLSQEQQDRLAQYLNEVTNIQPSQEQAIAH
ncbi:glycerol-3-phosphate dehydrogenase [Ectopseudomonas mendocina]|uniref:Glycerol-3-phosphate dehydrogenase n=1 Tax=Ectopseudomonas mendocina TaxID=300 RepID=A0ABZ2RM03_ECTME